MILQATFVISELYNQPIAIQSQVSFQPQLPTDTHETIVGEIDLSVLYMLRAAGLTITDIVAKDAASVYLHFAPSVNVTELYPSALPVCEGVVFITMTSQEITEALNNADLTLTAADVSLSLMAANVTDKTVELGELWFKKRIYNRFQPYATSVEVKTPVTPVGVNVFVMDSGINAHDQIQVPVNNLYTLQGTDFSDLRGHGTAMASLIAGKTLGNVADDVKLHNVKIFHDSGDVVVAKLIEAFIAIRNYAAIQPAGVVNIVNMSWGIPKNPMIEQVIASLQAANIIFICAAGNGGTSVDLITPASMTTTLTVAASDSDDKPCDFTNFNGVQTNHGSSVDIFAPGMGIQVADSTTTDKFKIVSGTSFSCAITTGVVALMAQAQLLKNQFEVNQYLATTSTKNALVFNDPKFMTTPNQLLYVDLITEKQTVGLINQYMVYDSAAYARLEGPATLYVGGTDTTVELNYDTTKLDLILDGNVVKLAAGAVKSTDPYHFVELIEYTYGPNTITTTVKEMLILVDPPVSKISITLTRDDTPLTSGISQERLDAIFAAHPGEHSVTVMEPKLLLESILGTYPELTSKIAGVTLFKDTCHTSTCVSQVIFQTCFNDGGSCGQTGDGDVCITFGATCTGDPCSATVNLSYSRGGDVAYCCVSPGASTVYSSYSVSGSYCNQ